MYGLITVAISLVSFAAEIPVVITAFNTTSNWGSIETEGPLHCVVDVNGYLAEPFSYGTFQFALKVTVLVPNKYLELGTKYILKQQRINGHLQEGINMDSLSPEEIDSIDAECERKSAKVGH